MEATVSSKHTSTHACYTKEVTYVVSGTVLGVQSVCVSGTVLGVQSKCVSATVLGVQSVCV